MLAKYHLNIHDFMRMRIADKKENPTKSSYSLADIRLRVRKVLVALLKGLTKADLDHILWQKLNGVVFRLPSSSTEPPEAALQCLGPPHKHFDKSQAAIHSGPHRQIFQDMRPWQ